MGSSALSRLARSCLLVLFLTLCHAAIVPTPSTTAKYDFVIVGGELFFFTLSFLRLILAGGTAGLVLANRLSENPSWNILVLEAGQRRVCFISQCTMAYTCELQQRRCAGCQNSISVYVGDTQYAVRLELHHDASSGFARSFHSL